MSKQLQILLVALVLAAAALRTNGLFENTFHADEALFATWARQIAVWRAPLLAGQVVDKPPLLFYLQALFYPLQGPVMWAARLPNFIASIALVPLTALLAWRLYRNEATVALATTLLVLSPMAIQFSASAFIDPLMTSLIVGSLTVMSGFSHSNSSLAPDERIKSNRRLWIAGLLFGLAIASKYQAWLFLPLVVGLGLSNDWRRSEWTRWTAGLLPVVGLVVIWEFSRSHQLLLLENQLNSYGGLRFAWSWELWPRLEAWAGQWAYILGSPILAFLLLLALPPFAASIIEQMDRSAAIDGLLALFVLSYSLLHWFIAVPVWDRYLLPLVPFVCILLARFLWRVAGYFWPAVSETISLPFKVAHLIVAIPLLILVFQVPAITRSYQGALATGTSPVADRGAAEIGKSLAKEPYGTVLYDHWFSWQWRYHLFDARVYISWFPDPMTLIEDLQVFADQTSRRYIVLPDSGQAEPVIRALAEASFSLEPIVAVEGRNAEPGMVLYVIQQDPQG